MTKPMFPKLADGEYLAKCKERSAISAALNGHLQVWPESNVVVKKGLASFFKGGVKVWECNPTYAYANFVCTPAPIDASVDSEIPCPKGIQQMSTPETHRDYPDLECPKCERLCKPKALRKDGSVTYSCAPNHAIHGSRYTWRIAKDGTLID